MKKNLEETSLLNNLASYVRIDFILSYDYDIIVDAKMRSEYMHVYTGKKY